jgi:hypothetical protein
MATPYPPDLYGELSSLINETYTDGLDRVVWARIEDDEATTVGVAVDGEKAIAFKIDNNSIRYKLVPLDQSNQPAYGEALPQSFDFEEV